MCEGGHGAVWQPEEGAKALSRLKPCPTIAYYSPLPPARTGVADYAVSLLGELRRHGDVRVGAERCDVALYHLGNNQLHREIYRKAIERPGVVVLHDACLQHFFLGSLERDEYIEEFVYNYGEWSREEAGELWSERAASAQDPRYFARPMLRRIAERSRVVVVHNPAAGAVVQTHAPEACVVEIPHLFAADEPAEEAAAWQYRQSIGAGAGTFLFGVFGYLRESKRLVTVLSAFTELHRMRPRSRLLIAGEMTSPDLARAVEPLLARPLAQSGVIRVPHLSERDLAMASAAVDCCINLRYPRAAETSGIGVRMMGIGKPVIVTEGAEYARVPETACLRVPPGVAERAALFEYMVTVSEFPSFARDVGRQAAEHIRLHHSLDWVGSQYWKILCDVCAGHS